MKRHKGLTIKQDGSIIKVIFNLTTKEKESSVKFIKNHNNNCKCGVTMTLGSF